MAGGQTDASIILGKSVIAASKGNALPPLRKVFLNFIGCFGMGCGGYVAEVFYKIYGLNLAVMPATALLASATVLPALTGPPAEELEKAEKAK